MYQIPDIVVGDEKKEKKKKEEVPLPGFDP